MRDWICRVFGHRWGDPQPRFWRLQGCYQTCARCQQTRLRLDLPNFAEIEEQDSTTYADDNGPAQAANTKAIAEEN